MDIQALGTADTAAAEELARIMIAAWRGGFRDILPNHIIEKYTELDPCAAMFRQLLTSSEGRMYLARLDGHAVGLLYLLPDGENARIEALLTIPEVWGKGVAAALMKQTLEDASAFRTITVWPFLENRRARRFYEKQGFASTGRTRMGDAEEVEYILRKSTRFNM